MRTKQHILLQTAAPKVPGKPSYIKFIKGTPSARFLKFCKVGTWGNSCKKKATKKIPWRQCHHVLIRISLYANLAQPFAANRGSQSAREAELCQICQGDPCGSQLKTSFLFFSSAKPLQFNVPIFNLLILSAPNLYVRYDLLILNNLFTGARFP